MYNGNDIIKFICSIYPGPFQRPKARNLCRCVWVVCNNKTAGSGRGQGVPDPALPLLFHENPASPSFFALLSQISFLVSLICVKLKNLLRQKLINITWPCTCRLTLSMKFWIYSSFKAIAKKKYFLNTWSMCKKEQHQNYHQGHPTAILGKISVRKMIWELEFLEHILL